MNFEQTCDYLFQKLASYQIIGQKAFNKSLYKTLELANVLGNPQNKFKSIHIAGTNGKGSSSSMLASIFQEAGYKVGLYTSPHLKSFTERIKVNGKEVKQTFVVDFVAKIQDFINDKSPSFFEITTLMAFEYFAQQKVDIAIIETGLGGKLDSTNILNPELCLITNIGLDHQNMLGNSLQEIAQEKAGIIKPNTPIVISQSQNEISSVFEKKATKENAAIYFADQTLLLETNNIKNGLRSFSINNKNYQLDLLGEYQLKNVLGILKSIGILQTKFSISEKNIQNGLKNCTKNISLKGRWQTLKNSPKIICDTGHNEDGIKSIVQQLQSEKHDNLFLILGMVSDKNYQKIIRLFPKKAEYVFCRPNINRALDPQLLLNFSIEIGLKGEIIEDVNEAIGRIEKKANSNDLIFIGGSTFVVAEVHGL